MTAHWPTRVLAARMILAAVFLAAAVAGATVPVDSVTPFPDRVMVGAEFFAGVIGGFLVLGGWKAFMLAAEYRVEGGRFWAWALLAASGSYAGMMLLVGIARLSRV